LLVSAAVPIALDDDGAVERRFTVLLDRCVQERFTGLGELLAPVRSGFEKLGSVQPYAPVGRAREDASCTRRHPRCVLANRSVCACAQDSPHRNRFPEQSRTSRVAAWLPPFDAVRRRSMKIVRAI